MGNKYLEKIAEKSKSRTKNIAIGAAAGGLAAGGTAKIAGDFLGQIRTQAFDTFYKPSKENLDGFKKVINQTVNRRALKIGAVGAVVGAGLGALRKPIEKSAERGRRKDPNHNPLRKAMVATTLGSLAATPAMLYTGGGLMEMHRSYNPDHQIGSGLTEENFLKEHGSTINADIEKVRGTILEPGPHFRPTAGGLSRKLERNVVVGSYNHGVHMHELGHALDLHKTTVPRTLALKGGAGLAGFGLMAKGFKDDNATEAAGGAILGSAPTLLHEARANHIAYKAFKQHEGKEVANRFLKKIVTRNTGNYWAAPLASAAVAGFMAHKINQDRERS